ncbi:MAG TPA: cytochrome P460 family protein [Vicinamibacterales bacterium]
MKRQHVTALAILALFTVTVVVLAAQDRFTLKSPNGIAFSELKGYDAWTVLAVSHPDNAGGCGTSKTGCIKAIVANPVMVKAYNDGFPVNGKPVPDGAMMAKIEWLSTKNPAAPYPVTVPGEQTEVGIMVKDSNRFRDTNGWGYATFQYDAATNTYKPATSDPAVMKTLCHACHTRGAKARDFVYTNYARR